MALATRNNGRELLVSTFNFDIGGSHLAHTAVWQADVQSLLRIQQSARLLDDSVASPLLQREGSCGFRGIAVHTGETGRSYVAVTDRNRHCLLLACITNDQSSLSASDFVTLDLRECNADLVEPIGVSIVPSEPPVYCVSSRKRPEMIVVGWNPSQAPHVKQRIALGGLSRSSIAVGRAREKQSWDIGVALWGGDPEDIDDAHSGELVMLCCDGTGWVKPLATRLPGGTNATDAVMGDFDGDGADEVAVLAYGVGLNHATRGEEGGVKIYKWGSEGWQLAWTLQLPHPRIGLAADIDGDGVSELVISLFFANRLAVIDFPGAPRATRG